MASDSKKTPKKNDYKEYIIEEAKKQLIDSNLSISGAISGISNIRNLKSYKLSLLLRRIKKQIIEGDISTRKDFLKWTIGKLTGNSNGSPLNNFDMLYEIEQRLWKQIYSNGQLPYSLMNNSIDFGEPKTTRQFFIFASVPYYDVGGGQRSAQIANTLNNMGYRVYYIYGFESSESKREEMYIPCVKHLHIDQYSIDRLEMDIEDDAVFIFEIPYSKFEPYLNYANNNNYSTIYEHIDNWDSSLGCLFYNKKDFLTFVHNSKYITVTAKVLGEKIEEVGRYDYIYSPNAVDSSLFEPSKTYSKPDDLVIGKKTLLYFGSLWGEWFDWNLVVNIAKKCDCTINLIGDYHPIEEKIKNMPKNIHFLGLKKHEDLPAYLKYSDVALLPFKNSIIGKYVSPLKIFEYIAMNKPVLSTPLDDIKSYPNVFLSANNNEWVKYVNSEVDVVDATIFTSENSWYARCNQILDLLGREREYMASLSIIVLNHNNMKVIFRCVNSLLSFSSSYKAEIIVVDNDSTDGSYEKLQETYGNRIKLIKNNKNGCSSGRNLGVAYSEGELLLFLDSDQWVVAEHYIDSAISLLENDECLGAVGWGAGWFESGKVEGPICDYLPNRGIRGALEMYRTDIAYLATDGMLVKRKTFDEVGGFDEQYDPTCFEDTDISLKIKNAGFKLAYCPYMAIMHLPHQTTKSGSITHKKMLKKNGEYFYNKWSKINPKLLECNLK